MKRNIYIRGEPIRKTLNEIDALKQSMSRQFGITPDQAEAFIKWLDKSGYTEEDVSSIAQQAHNPHRPPVDVFTVGHAAVFESLLYTQGDYTYHTDSAVDPNFAIRHRGATELILRRLTVGNLWMLSAAQYLNAASGYENFDPDGTHYWSTLCSAMIYLIDPTRHGVTTPAIHALLKSVMAFERMNIIQLTPAIHTSFFRRGSPLNIGCNFRNERMRAPDTIGYTSRYVIYTHGTTEDLYRGACILMAAAVDEHALTCHAEGAATSLDYRRRFVQYYLEADPKYIYEQG